MRAQVPAWGALKVMLQRDRSVICGLEHLEASGLYCAFPKGCERLARQKVANPFFFRALCLISTWQTTEFENSQYI